MTTILPPDVQPYLVYGNVLGDEIGFVELWDRMGNDRTIAAAARVSLAQELNSLGHTETEDRAALRDARLIHRLLKDNHTSPFEHIVMQFRVKAPLFTTRQWMRHRFSSFNEQSARYSIVEDECYIPTQWRSRTDKPMDYQYAPLDAGVAKSVEYLVGVNVGHSYETYHQLLNAGVAPEQARIVLPVGQYTTFIWTVNGLALMHFLSLRTDPHAQWEIQQYANAIEEMFTQYYPWTAEAWREYWNPQAVTGVNSAE